MCQANNHATDDKDSSTSLPTAFTSVPNLDPRVNEGELQLVKRSPVQCHNCPDDQVPDLLAGGECTCVYVSHHSVSLVPSDQVKRTTEAPPGSSACSGLRCPSGGPAVSVGGKCQCPSTPGKREANPEAKDESRGIEGPKHLNLHKRDILAERTDSKTACALHHPCPYGEAGNLENGQCNCRPLREST
ncbi:MAG: hypothetical protein LQ352_003912 [Teloschistes flavicans]|nr:MAG: hypothetical protein LQ352_003912 [Teloschistes flavicans]